jgi:hypothetical protein
MDIMITYNQENNLVIIEAKGDASVEGLSELIDQLFRFPQWESGMSTLIDFRNFSITPLKNDDIMKVSQMVKALKDALGDGDCAIAVSREIDYGLVRMWQIQTEPGVQVQIEVFMSYDEAFKWLVDRQ